MNREFTRRDSATTYLRKNGIPKDLYNNFITKINDVFVVNPGAVYEFCSGNKLKEQKPTKNVVVKLSKEVVNEATKLFNDSKPFVTGTAKKVKPEGVTVSSRSRELILVGKTNKEIWEIIKVEFKLGDNKRHYPAWYRSEMTRSGKLK